MKQSSIVIIGAGAAGAQVAISLREKGHQGPVTLIGEESEYPYDRPPLSKAFLLGDVCDPRAPSLRPSHLFAQLNIACRLGTRVGGIDRRSGRVVLEDVSTISYDHLVIATGSRARALQIVGADGPNVHYLRTVEDARRLRRELIASRAAVIAGAGFIGLEFAAVADGLGMKVRVIEADSRVMSRAVAAATSDYFRRSHEGRNVTFDFGTYLTGLTASDSRVTAVHTSDGRSVETDMLLVGIGAVPATELALDAGLEVDDGIVVDLRLLTSDPTISAIGDCVAISDIRNGRQRIRVESVQNALDQARCVASRLAGDDVRYAAVPWFWSDQGADRLQIAGLSRPSEEDVHLRGDPASNSFSAFRFVDERLVAVDSVNRPADHMAARLLLSKQIMVDPDQVRDPDFDLKALVRR